MGRKDTKAIKSITKMYEQLELAQDDIFHTAQSDLCSTKVR